jgi:hypothetical protein
MQLVCICLVLGNACTPQFLATVRIRRGSTVVAGTNLFKLIILLGYEIFTDTYIHSDTQAEPRKLSSLTIYIELWQEGEPAPGQNRPVISPPVVIFRRIGVGAEIQTQNPVLSNTRLAKMVPLSHLRRLAGANAGDL